MQQPIVMSFSADGTVEYTRNSQFIPFDGHGIMQRVTDIQKERYGNKFYILWMLGLWAGCKHTRLIARNYFNPDGLIELERQGLCPRYSPEYMRDTDPMLFDTYEDAVQHEIVMLNAMRKKGDTFYDETEQA